jgi:hypothetical protein
MSNSFQYIDVLEDIVKSYNDSKHRSIGMAPSAVSPANEKTVFKMLFPKGTQRLPTKFAFTIGDTVRLTKQKDPFAKGYQPGYTDELFTVTEVLKTLPTRYKINDVQGDQIEGSFYAQEMIKSNATPETLYKIEKIIRRRTVYTKKRNSKGRMVKVGKQQLFVKWQGYPDKFNSWVDEADSQSI